MSFDESAAVLPILAAPAACQRELAPGRKPAGRANSHGGKDGDAFSLALLAEQNSPTAVEEFSAAHDRGDWADARGRYAKLMPAGEPGAGQQYAFEVDLDRCSGCKACVVACHALNGLDEQEAWRDVGLLIGGTSSEPLMQHVTTACHHCLEPACMSACPVDAYEKDPRTGIVRHLDDQCFGCQYCTLACPYDVPKYNAAKGIVRKCDMCADRLSEGEPPACAQACPNEAIRITLADLEEIREGAEADRFLPAAPAPHLTFPTTSYHTERVFPRNMLPADYYAINPQHPHWPLIVMLVLTQLSVGMFGAGLPLAGLMAADRNSIFQPVQALLALLAAVVALAASTCHLGRPWYAYRAVIGLRHSWLSREIVAFGLFATMATAYSAGLWSEAMPAVATRLLGMIVVAAGGAGVFCSVMVYVATGRRFWSFNRTMTTFGLTAVNLGLAASWLALGILEASRPAGVERETLQSAVTHLPYLLMGSMVFKLLYEASLFLHLLARRNTALKRSARLSVGPLGNVFISRIACGVTGGVIGPLLLISRDVPARFEDPVGIGGLASLCLATLVGELLERYHFFAAVSAPRMPGNPRS